MFNPSDEIDNFIKQISRLPSVGKRTATRIALNLIANKDTKFKELIDVFINIRNNVKICPLCGNFDTSSPCRICGDINRDKSIICLISDVASLWAIERTASFNGLYHILGGVLSVSDGITPEKLKLNTLIDKLQTGTVKEIIIALPSTIDGKITSHYILGKIKKYNIKVTEIAQGVPIGGELDYLDDGTITEAIKYRKGL